MSLPGYYSSEEIAAAKLILEQVGYTVEKRKPKCGDEVNVRISGHSIEARSPIYSTLTGTVADLDLGDAYGEVYVVLNNPSRTGVWVALADVDPLEGGSYGV